MYKYDFCYKCVGMVADALVITYVIETSQAIHTIDTTNADKISSGEWHVMRSGDGTRLPLIATTTFNASRLCSMHAVEPARISLGTRYPMPGL